MIEFDGLLETLSDHVNLTSLKGVYSNEMNVLGVGDKKCHFVDEHDVNFKHHTLMNRVHCSTVAAVVQMRYREDYP